MAAFDNKGGIIVPAHIRERQLLKARKLSVKTHLSNFFFKGKIMDRSGDKCSNCGTDCDNKHRTLKGKDVELHFEIHHKTYHWGCHNPPEEIVERGDFDCETCFSKTFSTFEHCLSNCVLLCNLCHVKHHSKLNKTTGDWIGKDEEDTISDDQARCKYCNGNIEGDFLYCPSCDRKLKV